MHLNPSPVSSSPGACLSHSMCCCTFLFEVILLIFTILMISFFPTENKCSPQSRPDGVAESGKCAAPGWTFSPESSCFPLTGTGSLSRQGLNPRNTAIAHLRVEARPGESLWWPSRAREKPQRPSGPGPCPPLVATASLTTALHRAPSSRS